MIAIIATAIACFIVGGVLSYILFRYVLKSKYDNVLKEAETEAEVIKKNKLLEVKEKFLNKKADLEKEAILNPEKAEKRKQELKEAGIKADIIREEPFVEAKDSVQYKIYIMKWKTQHGNYHIKIEEITI